MDLSSVLATAAMFAVNNLVHLSPRIDFEGALKNRTVFARKTVVLHHGRVYGNISYYEGGSGGNETDTRAFEDPIECDLGIA